MEFFIDRRSDSCPRVPLESEIVVEFDGLSEPMAVECVDLSTGGISLRSPLLPDEGTAVFCSFEKVVETADFGAWGRVVWVQNQGERCSEFGVSFQNLDTETESRISEILSQNAFSPPSTPKIDPHARAVKLLFDGSASPVEAQVVDRVGDRVTFGQTLDLLRLGRGLLAYESHEDSFRGRIESVDLQLDGQVPQLFITVKPDPIGFEQSVERRVESKVLVHANESGIGQAQFGDEVQWNAGTDPEIEPQPHIENKPALSQTDPPKRSDDHCTLFTLPEDDAKEERNEGKLYDEPYTASSRVTTGTRDFLAFVAVLWAPLRSLLCRLGDRVNQWMRENGTRLIYRANRWIRSGLIPSIISFAKRLITLRLLRRKRRTTAVASPLTASSGKSNRYGERYLWPRIVRPIVLPFLAIGGIALAVYGFNPWSDSGRVPLHRPVHIEKTDQRSGRSLEQTDPQRVSTQTSVSSVAVPAVNSQNATATLDSELALTQREGSTPGNASLEHGTRSGVNRRSSTGSTTSSYNEPSEPTNAEFVEKAPRKTTFGSQIRVAGHRYTLRMSNEITELRGIPEKGGFTVIIPGSLSFDRAGPIAAAHPLVARSAILNKGDHSALTVRFARGKSPAYRVIAKGTSLEITIAERS